MVALFYKPSQAQIHQQRKSAKTSRTPLLRATQERWGLGQALENYVIHLLWSPRVESGGRVLLPTMAP